MLRKIVAILLLLLAGQLFAQINNKYHSPEKRLQFGNHLFKEKDYLRAYEEYKAFLSSENNDTVRFKAALSLYNLKRNKEAEDYMKSIFFSSPLAEEARLEYYKFYFFTDCFEEYRKMVEYDTYHPVKYKKEIVKLSNISYLLEGNSLPDSATYASCFDSFEQRKMIDFYNFRRNPPFKSPLKASILSAIIPGLGKAYVGEYTDGVTSLLLSGVCGYLAYRNFDKNRPTRAWIFTGLTAFFYGGNIYGSYAEAQKYNAGVIYNFRDELKLFLNKNNYFLPEYGFAK